MNIETFEAPLPTNVITKGQILFVEPCEEMETTKIQRIYFHKLAIGLERFLRTHMPQGLYDHLYAVMAMHQASVLAINTEQESDTGVDRDCAEMYQLVKALSHDYSFLVVDADGESRLAGGSLEQYSCTYLQVEGRRFCYSNIIRINIHPAQRYVKLVEERLD